MGKWEMGKWEMGKWGSGKWGSGGISTKTLKPQNPPQRARSDHPISCLLPLARVPHLNWLFKYLTAYNSIKMCNNSLASS
ncbi:hypothetical protein B5D77_15735 [Microcystis sp. MC19]|nr:hypothetical protein B5D77_15735 [Microcystis sp. MC19]